MKRPRSTHSPSRTIPMLVAAGVALYTLGAACLIAADPKPAPVPDPKPAKSAEPKKAARKKPTGADLYAMHCNRCHPERYATERTAAQWKTIMLHMRVRANLPADEAKTILKYLQEDSGK